MGKFHVIHGTPAPDTPANQVRKRIREMRNKDWPCCIRCGGRETITATIGNVRSKLCVVCLLSGQRIVVE